jgi:hypothetical protein
MGELMEVNGQLHALAALLLGKGSIEGLDAVQKREFL